MQPVISAKRKGRNGSAYDDRQKIRHAPGRSAISHRRQPVAAVHHEAGVMTRRLLALVFLVLLIIGLLLSIAAFFQGRIFEGLSLYPLLIVIYVFIQIGKKKKQ
jgi:hypothetical protein